MSETKLKDQSLRPLAKCRVTISTDITLTSSTPTKALLDTESFDTGGNWASSTFTVPTGGDGYYRIYFHAYFYSGSGSSLQYANIYRNGSAIASDIRLPAGVPATSQVSAFVHLDATDTIEFYVQKNAASWKVFNGADTTFATIEQVSAD